MNLSPQMYRVTEVLGENINTDGELSHHGVDQRLVTLVLWGMGELEIEWLQNMVKGTGSIANQATIKRDSKVVL